MKHPNHQIYLKCAQLAKRSKHKRLHIQQSNLYRS